MYRTKKRISVKYTYITDETQACDRLSFRTKLPKQKCAEKKHLNMSYNCHNVPKMLPHTHTHTPLPQSLAELLTHTQSLLTLSTEFLIFS